MHEDRLLSYVGDTYAVLRVDTHGNRFIVKQTMSKKDAKQLVNELDKLPHHQGYYFVKDSQVKEELDRSHL